MHIHIQRPSAASALSLATTIGVVTLCGCAEWSLQTRAEAADRFMQMGEYTRAVVSLLPIPWALPAAGIVAVAGHLGATVIRRGKKPDEKLGQTKAPTDEPPVA